MNKYRQLAFLASAQVALATTAVGAEVSISGYIDLGFSFNNIERTGEEVQHKSQAVTTVLASSSKEAKI